MGKEIERKFLVNGKSILNEMKGTYFKQGYLSSIIERTVRVRVYDDKGFITIKGKNHGASRAEFEYEIPFVEALEILDNLCERPIIEKYRYILKYNGKIFEIDEFLGENSGLVMAEVEIMQENEEVDLPPWIGEEVTNDIRYYNSSLIKNPYMNW